ncbi:hypothetical protein D5H75_39280 [Bailinhaonella thermotolerans]|uniref:Tissue inhibitor of metalloproteinase n=2 Tax=Bailinhaonella thermotolerans TaxID=1070861 RepID=A0A3A4AIW9_9ACTN|nr:hypothetical protein D5H75_39280 [Bailinhaonella thermotolerans]
MARIAAVLAMAASLVLLPTGTACACSCAEPEPRELVASATAVFTATATGVRLTGPAEGGGRVVATLSADHVYKGETRAEFTMSTAAQSPACGYAVKKGERYLIFARTGGSGLETDLCSGNRRLPAGDRPLRLTDETHGLSPLTADLITALGSPTRVRPASAESPTARPSPTSPGETTPAATSSARNVSRSSPLNGAGPLLAILAAAAIAGGAVVVIVRRRRSG